MGRTARVRTVDIVMSKRNSSSGVELREKSVRIIFTWRGKQFKETLTAAGKPMDPLKNTTVKYAERLAQRIREEIANGTFDFAAHFPESARAKSMASTRGAVPGLFGEFIDRWYGLLDLKSSTKKIYARSKESFWKPQFEGRTIASIKHSEILQALKDGAWKSGKTRNNNLGMIRGVFTLAVRDGLIKENPCDGIENASYQKPQIQRFSFEEAESIIKDMYEHYPEPVGNFYQFMFFTGLRSSEGFGLEWSCVDFEKKTALVRQGFVYDELVDDTKTSKARYVKLNSRALDALVRQTRHTQDCLIPLERVFNDPGTGKPWAYEQNARKRYWTPTLKRLGLRYQRPYNTRHTYASIGLMSGANPAFMARQLGHNLQMFFSVYSEWIEGDDSTRELDKIEEKLAGG
jgi:integrase